MRMLDAEVFLVSQIDEPVITSPTIGMNDAFKVYTSTYDALEGGSGAIRNDLAITGNSFPESRHIPVDGVSVNTGQFRNL